MQAQGTKDIERIKGFFKSSVYIENLGEVLDFKADSLIGIDRINADILNKFGIETIKDLAAYPVEKLSEVKEIPEVVLDKWIKVAKIIEDFISSSRFAQKKILLIGLDNSGKTSILNILQDRYSIVKNLLPTRGVAREQLDFFGYPIISWDLGGQVQYRENLYFKKPELYFTEADLILYVIDIQDPKRFVESANYFKVILQTLKDLNESPEILIILNKYDPDLKEDAGCIKNLESVRNKFRSVVKEFDMETLDFEQTTVFDSSTIKKMFSVALMKVSETSEIIDKILAQFNVTINGRAISIISMDGLIFGSYSENDTDEMLINNTALLMQTLMNFHTSIGLIRENSILLNYSQNDFSIRGEKLFDYGERKIPVYLWVLAKDVAGLVEHLKYFSTEVMPLINLFI